MVDESIYQGAAVLSPLHSSPVSISLAVWTGTICVRIPGSLDLGHTHGPEVTFPNLIWNDDPNISGGTCGFAEKPNGNMKHRRL